MGTPRGDEHGTLERDIQLKFCKLFSSTRALDRKSRADALPPNSALMRLTRSPDCARAAGGQPAPQRTAINSRRLTFTPFAAGTAC
jgi:hypothetical protein